jgi:anti-sigma regulatory factor (Ser/Thr protein kinase)
MPHAELLRLRLRCDATAPRRVRKALDRLDEIRPARDDVLLVASELTTNAVLHSGSDSSSEIELRAELVPDGVRIAVSDEGRSQKQPRPRPASARMPGGLGLPIVEAISRRWGSERPNGLRVWAELAL